MKSLFLGGELLESKIELLPWQKQGLSYTATGYGSKIPTQYKVKYNGRYGVVDKDFGDFVKCGKNEFNT